MFYHTDTCTHTHTHTQAVDLALKFVPVRSVDVVALASDRLASIGRYVQAGELYLCVEMVKEGLDMFMAGEAWEKARDIAKNIAPRCPPPPFSFSLSLSLSLSLG